MTLNAPIATAVHSQNWGGMDAIRTRPRAMARRRSARASFREGRPESVTALLFDEATEFDPSCFRASGAVEAKKGATPIGAAPFVISRLAPDRSLHLPKRPTMKLTFG